MELDFTEIAGEVHDPALVVFSLSNCKWCEAAAKFLAEKGFAYRSLYVDKLPLETLRQVKKRISRNGTESIVYPVLEINGEEYLYGFDPAVWTEGIDAAART